MDPSRNNPHNHHDSNHHLCINKLSRQIRKSPPPPAFRPAAARPTAPHPQVYNISKNDFRDIVQQLTGTPTRDPIPNNPQPPFQARPHGQPSQRLHKIRPPPLTPMARPLPPPPYQNPNHNNPNPFPMPSPVTAYMRYLESSLLDTSRQLPGQQPGLLPSPVVPQAQPLHPPFFVPPGPAPFPSPRIPLSPFLQSPTAFLNLLSPKSPYPLLSPPGFQYPPPLMPYLPLSPGILGPSPGLWPPPPPPGAPPSPGFFFPNSPSGLLSPSNFFPIQSPRWRNG